MGLTLGDAGGSVLGGSVTWPRPGTLRATGLRAGLLVVTVRLGPEPTGVLNLEGFSYVRGVSVSGNPRRVCGSTGPPPPGAWCACRAPRSSVAWAGGRFAPT